MFPQDQRILEDNSIEVDPSFVDPQTPVFALHVKGDSMIDALIKDGDYVVIRSQEHAETGDMVAAWLIQEEETTLKRFFPEGDKIRLQPENSSMSPIFVDAKNVQIKGRVVGVLRKYK